MRNALIQALHDPRCYPHPVGRVELIETHISWVLLAGDFVYKIKKPLDLGFLDFSTLERRRFFCEEEIRLNRRTAPELYLDVVPITGTPEDPRIAGEDKRGEDKPFEYAVRMRRFDPEATFDRLLSRGQLQPGEVSELGRGLAELHARAAIAPPDSRHGHHQAVAGPMFDNFRTLRGQLADDRFDPLERWTRERLHKLNPLIAQRLENGFVRECHGDAHLGNVARIDSRATLFDCIEFSAELRWTDVICDLAFTFMDLRHRGADALAWRLLDEYLAETGDFEGMRLLPLYSVYRALVRAKVNAFRLNDPDADHDGIRQEIESHLRLADEISREIRPGLFLTMGVSGSGKSWLAERLVEHCGLIRIRSDIERKRLFGLARDEQSESGLDAGLYTAEATERTYRHLADTARKLIRAGFPVLVDATFLKRNQREPFLELARSLQVPFGLIECRADESTLRQRINDRARAGNDPSEADLEVLEKQLDNVEPPDEFGRDGRLQLSTGGEDAVERAAEWLSGRLIQLKSHTLPLP
ncbi:MAG: AAA family ATPase [Wenzhouxiangellaceae bacterium]